MFTSITHPVGDREIQIKTGSDSCDTYRLGDKVDWYADPFRPGRGKLLDGVYSGNSLERVNGEYKHPFDDKKFIEWVIIKNHTVHAIVLAPIGFEYQETLEKQFGIQPLPRNTWCRAAYKLEAHMEAKAKKRHARIRREHPNTPTYLLPLVEPVYDQPLEKDPVRDRLWREIERDEARKRKIKGKPKLRVPNKPAWDDAAKVFDKAVKKDPKALVFFQKPVKAKGK
jgi:hypothetical protein